MSWLRTGLTLLNGAEFNAAPSQLSRLFLLLFGVIVLVSLRVLLFLMAERLRPCLRLQTTRAHRAARHGPWGRCGTALPVT